MSEKIIDVLSFYKFIKLQSLEVLKKEIWRFMSDRNIPELNYRQVKYHRMGPDILCDITF